MNSFVYIVQFKDYKPEISEESSELQTFSLDPNMDYYCLVNEGHEARPDVGFISKFNTALLQGKCLLKLCRKLRLCSQVLCFDAPINAH